LFSRGKSQTLISYYSGSSGIFCLGPSLIISAAFILSLYSSSICDFVELDDDNVLRETLFEPRAVGLWCYQQVGSGDRYELPDELEDDELDQARAFSMTANCCGFIAWVFYLFAACVPFPPPLFLLAGLACVMACFFEGMKFWILRSGFCDGDNLGCSMDTGGRLAISACVFWFVASLLTCGHAKERTDANKDGGGDVANREVGGEDANKEVGGEDANKEVGGKDANDEEEETHTGEDK
jgi:hypothetical protein